MDFADTAAGTAGLGSTGELTALKRDAGIASLAVGAGTAGRLDKRCASTLAIGAVGSVGGAATIGAFWSSPVANNSQPASAATVATAKPAMTATAGFLRTNGAEISFDPSAFLGAEGIATTACGMITGPATDCPLDRSCGSVSGKSSASVGSAGTALAFSSDIDMGRSANPAAGMPAVTDEAVGAGDGSPEASPVADADADVEASGSLRGSVVSGSCTAFACATTPSTTVGSGDAPAASRRKRRRARSP